MKNLTETNLTEQSLIEWLKVQGYEHIYGPDINPRQPRAEREDFRGVVLKDRLIGAIRRINPQIGATQAEAVAKDVADYHHDDPMLGNKEMYSWIVNGKKVSWRENGEEKSDIVKLVDFKNIENNEFLAVNQFTVQGIDATNRFDVVVFVNGIPLGLFELKNPVQGSATIGEAYRQVERYKKETPKIFLYNQIIGLSDLIHARHGTISSSWERYGIWKGIVTPFNLSPEMPARELEILAKGLFDKNRLLDVIQNFFVFEADGDGEAVTFTKKMCLYHQYYGVNATIDSTLRAVAGEQERKIGVFWHTQGSGKSLSMVFYVNKTKHIEELRSPAYLFLTDREDLDDQLSKLFKRVGYETVVHRATSIVDLQKQLSQLDTGVSRILFTTIQKFQDYKEEYKEFSTRDNVIVLADEAHRTQYSGLAGNVRKALPQASFLAVTGTPIAKEDGRNTQRVFGDIVSSYKVSQAVEDGATVNLYYEARLIPLSISNTDLQKNIDAIVGDDMLEEDKMKVHKEWTMLEEVVGTKSRVERIARDIVEHFNNRPIDGKAMVVTMSRRIAVEIYEEIQKIKDAPECAVVISGFDDFKGRVQNETDVKVLEKRIKNSKDPLKIAIVCDMWLTGFDVPSMHTLYIDKPLKAHGLMQAIARVNRVYKDKSAGLIVDYIGIAENLKKSLSVYDNDIVKDTILPVDDIAQKIQEMKEKIVGSFEGYDFSDWKSKKGVELNKILCECVEIVISKNGILSDDKKMEFVANVSRMTELYSAIMPDPKAHVYTDDIKFFNAIKGYIKKYGVIPKVVFPEDAESAIKNVLDNAISTEGVIDLFADGDNKKAISIFDKKFESEIEDVKFKNFAVDAVRNLLEKEIKTRSKHNAPRYESIFELLKNVIEKYENNIISSAEIIKQLLEIAEEIKKLDEESLTLGLSPEEVSFYDTLQTDPDLKKLGIDIKDFVKELVSRIRRDLTIDWTNNENIKARVKQNVRLLLLQKGIIEHMQTERLVQSIYMETVRVYRDYVTQ